MQRIQTAIGGIGTAATISRIAVCVLAIALGGAGAVGQSVIHVPADFETIQAAIDAAENGDEIVVAPGTYTEPIDLLGKAVHLRSANGPAATVLESSGSFSYAIMAESGEGPATVVEGFTFTNPVWQTSQGLLVTESSPTIRNCYFIAGGKGGSVDHGGAIKLVDSESVIEDCLFLDNLAIEGGGAIWIDGGGPTVRYCVLIGNLQWDLTGFQSGGHAIFAQSSDVLIEGCMFDGNGSDANPTGTGIATVRLSLNGVIDQCTFSDNAGMFGGGVTLVSGGSIVRDSHFSGNTALMGGGIFASGATENPPVIENCTFHNNSTTGGGGGGIHLQGDAVVTDCTFESNTAGSGGGAIFAWNWFDQIQIDDCVFTGNSADDGGALATHEGDPDYLQKITVTDCQFIDNTADETGGAVAHRRESWHGPMQFVGCTFESNEAPTGGAFSVVDGAQPPAAAQSILCGNAMPTFLGEWINEGGNVIADTCPPGDLSGDGLVNAFDLGILLSNWGPCDDCETPDDCTADLTGDCFVGGADLGVLLGNWTE